MTNASPHLDEEAVRELRAFIGQAENHGSLDPKVFRRVDLARRAVAAYEAELEACRWPRAA